MPNKLSNRKCLPCEGIGQTLSDDGIRDLLSQISDWQLIEEEGIKKVVKKFEFPDFKGAVDFVDKVAEVAEEEGHHPDICIFSYNRVKICLYTHKIKGLSENDFILASKIDDIVER